MKITRSDYKEPVLLHFKNKDKIIDELIDEIFRLKEENEKLKKK
ncbi:MAG: hypothetical protein ABH844_01215 [Candidatus Omnitrophota bacterium]